MEMITVKKGMHMLNSSLTVLVEEDITLLQGETYLLNGDNGCGKTSFIRKIILPQISKLSYNNFLIYYIEQDFSLQFHIIQSYYKGLKKVANGFDTYAEALFSLKREFNGFTLYENKNIVFILDEVDQHVNLKQFLDDINIILSTVILTTHDSAFNIDRSSTTLDFVKDEFNRTRITTKRNEINC